jgi:hypothetical protein
MGPLSKEESAKASEGKKQLYPAISPMAADANFKIIHRKNMPVQVVSKQLNLKK